MIGFFIVLLSSAFFCFQNVIVRILFKEQSILGLFDTGGFVAPTFQNTLLLVFMRMILALPMMACVVPILYPPTWKDLRQLGQPERRGLLGRSLAGGGLMFLYLMLLYISVGLIPTGIALTLFFTYPVFTALFSWKWLGARLTMFRWIVMGFVLVGSCLTMPLVSATNNDQTFLGIVTGIASGAVYGLYTVNAQKIFEQMHPFPFTWLSFAITLLLSAVVLLCWHGQLDGLAWGALWIGGFLSAFFTFGGHLLNNLGIQRIGATAAAMLGASNPALTVVLAWLVIQESLNWVQVVGVLIVTLSVASLSQEKAFAERSR